MRLGQRFKIYSIGILGLILFSLTHCGPKRAVTRTTSDSVVDLSGRWNDTDSQLVSREMISDCLGRPWLSQFEKRKNRAPVVIVGRITNRTYERIPTDTFVKDLERSLINSGEVEFVADSSQRAQIRSERKDQAMHSSEETQNETGNEIGADFMLQGQINAILDQAGGTQVRTYQVELELINLLTNRKAWIGQKKIKKVVDQKAAGW